MTTEAEYSGRRPMTGVGRFGGWTCCDLGEHGIPHLNCAFAPDDEEKGTTDEKEGGPHDQHDRGS